jgi:hypothetical protein
LKSSFVIGATTANVYVYAVREMGGLENEAQRNVKTDLLQIVPRHRTTLRNINFNLTPNPRIA